MLTAFIVSLLTLLAPPAADAPVERVAYGSCVRQTRPAPIFGHVNAYAPDAFVFLGDNVYGDTLDMDEMAADYRALGELTGVRELMNSARVLAIWDDHDLGQNDAGVEFPKKEESKRVMLDFFGEPAASGRRQREGNYDSVTLGPPGRRVQFVLLDTRWFRSPLKTNPDTKARTYVGDDSPEATVLGEAQFEWLKQTLQEPADFRVVCTSIQLLSDRHRFEKWANFPLRRREMIDLLAQSGPLVVLSGDRHRGEISRDDESGIVEVTASSLNQVGSSESAGQDEPNPYRVSPVVYAANFGTLDLDWDKRQATVALRDRDGEAVGEATISLDK